MKQISKHFFFLSLKKCVGKQKKNGYRGEKYKMINLTNSSTKIRVAHDYFPLLHKFFIFFLSPVKKSSTIKKNRRKTKGDIYVHILEPPRKRQITVKKIIFILYAIEKYGVKKKKMHSFDQK